MAPNRNLPFHDRKIWTYYLLFFAGTLTLAYQALNIQHLGDSVDLLCLLFLLGSFSIRRKLHIFENALLVTCGYILPLLIRNTMKLSYSEAPNSAYFLELGAKSALVTFALGCIFSFMGWILRRGFFVMAQRRKAAQVVASIKRRSEIENQTPESSKDGTSQEENPSL